MANAAILWAVARPAAKDHPIYFTLLVGFPVRIARIDVSSFEGAAQRRSVRPASGVPKAGTLLTKSASYMRRSFTLMETATVSSKAFTFYLPVGLVNQVREYAKQQGIRSASDVVEQFVSDALKAKGTK